MLMGRGKHLQARTLERVDARAFEGSELLAACREDTLFGGPATGPILVRSCRPQFDGPSGGHLADKIHCKGVGYVHVHH